MNPVIAIDLGGTNIKIGVVRGTEVLAAKSIPANAPAGLGPQLPRIETVISELCGTCGIAPAKCAGIGMAVPFLVDPVANRIRSVPPEKYGDACGIDLPTWAKERFGLKLKLENDAHAACLGEWRHGAGRGSDDLVMLTLGTGIGCSVILRGRPLRGKHFQAGVLGGHLIGNPDGAPCAVCPGTGCYEAESASLSLPRLAQGDPRFAGSCLAKAATIDFAAVFKGAAAGDALAQEIRDRNIRWWSALAVSLIHAYDPDRVVVGGAVARDAAVILPAMQAYVNRHAWIVEPVEFRAAELGNDAGLVGAATLLSQEFQCI
jgi:glucokinase